MHNAPTGKRTARLRKPRAVCLSSTLSYQPADEYAGGAAALAISERYEVGDDDFEVAVSMFELPCGEP